jgi:CheY-like chemotaxis protein
VDDDASVRESLGLALESENFRIIPASNSQEALEKYFEGSIDLVLLDLHMPENAGWDTFERLTALNPYLAIIVVTECLNQRDQTAVAGAAALVGKPLNVPSLVQIMNGLLEESFESRVHRAATQRAAVLQN